VNGILLIGRFYRKRWKENAKQKTLAPRNHAIPN